MDATIVIHTLLQYNYKKYQRFISYKNSRQQVC
jgi:hypothetical protein